MQNLPLSDLKVLELCESVSGPYCAKLLAGFGAEVVKIENPEGGDISRCHGPFPRDIPEPEKSGLFLELNTNKKSITLNWQTRTGYRILEKLIRQADILLETDSISSVFRSAVTINPFAMETVVMLWCMELG